MTRTHSPARTAPSSPTAAAVAAQLATEPWFMRSDRVRALLQQAKLIAPKSAEASPRDTAAAEPSYEVLGGGVAVINVVGTLVKYSSWYDDFLSLTPTSRIKDALASAVADPSVRHIALRIDSPGGTIHGTTELAAAVVAANKSKPLYAIVSDRALSGGYFIACGCRQISCNLAGQVGCIGVYSVLMDDSKFWADLGIAQTLVTTGGVKGLGADGRVTAELIADVQREVNAFGDLFIDAIAAGRGISRDAAAKLADGRSWLAADAKVKNLIDVITEADAAINYLAVNSGPAAKGPSMAQTSNNSSHAAANSGADPEARWAAMSPEQRAGWLDKETFMAYARWEGGGGSLRALEQATSSAQPGSHTSSNAHQQAEREWDQGRRADGTPVDRSAWIDKPTFIAARAWELRSQR